MEFTFTLIAIILIAAAGLAVLAALRHGRRIDEAWRRVATELRLEYTPPQFLKRRALTGTLRGYAVDVRPVRRRRHNRHKTFTRLRLEYDDLGLGLQLGRRGPFAGLAALMGLGGVEVGDDDFDRQVHVRGANAAALETFLTPERRARISSLIASQPRCRIGDEHVEVLVPGMQARPEPMVATLRRLAQLADTFQEKRADEDFSQAVEAELEGDLARAVELYSRGSARDDVDARTRQAELLNVAGHQVEAGPLLAELALALPDDRQIALLAQEPPQRPREIVRPEITTDGIPSMCAELFAPGLMSAESNRLFEERYAGRPVHWHGVLVGVRRFTNDLVFGATPALRARFRVHDLLDDAYGEREVHAIVALPLTLEADLATLEGEPCAFEGRLLHCDAFMRILFIERGQLTARPTAL